MKRALTPPQTVGPFFHGGMLTHPQNVLVSAETPGERIRIEGHVYDGDHAPVSDAVVEIWQANAGGRYHHPADRRDVPLDGSFVGFGRAGTDGEGFFWFETVRPGPVPFLSEGDQAPHVSVSVLARGLLHHLSTRLYFGDETANAADPVLHRVPNGRRATLVAAPAKVEGKTVYRFDIVLQGDGETVFFEF
ncbi:MAG TPA: protocatechuate 3,4-dioxygenase subunit alpha [bacterium]